VRADHNQSTGLRRLASTVAGEPVAFQGQDAYARWELRRADYVYTGGTADLTGESGALRTAPVPAKATRMIAPRSLYAPSAGPEFRLLKRTRWYDAFRRGAPPRSLFVARQEAAPGALLSCRHARTRALARHGWSALVKAQPVVGPGRAWTDPTGRPAFASEDFTLLALERTLRQQLALPPGRWELSLRYYSREPIRVRAGPLTRPMPAYLADRTSFWRVGSVTSVGRPIAVEVTGGENRRIQPRDTASELYDVAAVREDRPARLVPLRHACGRYVDYVTPPRTRTR
jgi:hypothetical protein